MNETDRTIVGLLWHENIIDVINKFIGILNKIVYPSIFIISSFSTIRYYLNKI